MAKYTVMISTYQYVEGEDEIDAMQKAKAGLPEGTGIQNMQVVPGTQQFSQHEH